MGRLEGWLTDKLAGRMLPEADLDRFKAPNLRPAYASLFRELLS